MPAGPAAAPAPRAPREHTLVRVCDFVVCRDCGAYAAKAARNLKKECMGPIPRGSGVTDAEKKRAKRRDRILDGRHPEDGRPLRQ